MRFFGKLTAGLGALAQNTLNPILAKVDRLDDWTPDTPPERTDYGALFREATSLVHPVIDARIRLRTVERNVMDSYACREPAVVGALDALDMKTRGDLAAEVLKRYAFLDYCVYFTFNRNKNAAITTHDNFGLPQDALVALEGDFEHLARTLLRRGLEIDAEQTGVLARIMTFAGGPPVGPSASSIRQFIHYVQPLFCTPETAVDDRKKLALLRLFNALGESAGLRAYPDMGVTQFVEALAKTIGVAPETHPLVQAKLAATALVEDGKRAVVRLAGPRLAGFFEAAYAHQNYNSRKYVQEHADLSAIDALSPEDRALSLFDCLRVFNFAIRSWTHARAKAWPDVKLTSFDRAAYPNLGKYTSEPFSAQVLDQLFTALARKKMALDPAMQEELLVLFRSDIAPNMLRSPQTVKIVEGFAKGNASPRVRKELEAAIAWLKTSDDHYTKKFKDGALHRLEKALDSMAPPAADSAPIALRAAGRSDAESRQGFGMRLPGGFGRRVEAPPAAATIVAMSTLAKAASEERPLPPPSKPDSGASLTSLVDFYGDLADLRKCSAEHIAFLDAQIAGEIDIEAETRRRMANNPMLRRLNEVEQGRANANIRAQIQNELTAYRGLMEKLKARVLAISAIAGEAGATWTAFHDHARALYGKSKPAAAWLKRAHEILDAVPREMHTTMVKNVVLYPCSTAHHPTDDAVRGLVYAAARLPAEKVGSAVSDFARKECFQTVPGSGIRDKRMGNACLRTLINMPGGAGVPYLARLLNRVKYPSVKKVINAALDEAAAKAGMSRGTLDELSVPTHDIEDGKRTIALGPDGGAALLEIVGTADVALSFRRADGKTTASVPAELKEFKAEIKQAKEAAKEIEADLTTQIARLQRIWLENRDWSFADWSARYAEHPLLAQLTRRLIWEVTPEVGRTSATLVDGVLTDVEGRPVAADASRIALWHPIGRPIAEVLAWRQRLQALGVVQPFKQAHREVYCVTDAERTTGVYSNCFAGHILRQHQMMTLARLNHWNVTHRIWADVRNDEPTHLVLPAWNIVAELWTWGAGGDDPEVSDSQAYLYVSTNQVRFYRFAGEARVSAAAFGPARGEAIRMEEVPPIVFSEVMRHCDLFTSVASVANDPNWADAGAEAQHPNQWRRTEGNAYWRDAALGDLGQSATSRKEVIEAMLPSLKIAERCAIDGNFLRVQGKLRAYKIHFGSANIMMEPDNRYICIVPGTAKDSGRVMLPFEGDTMLSTILSKAMLLVADDKITDTVIVRQIYR